MNPLFLILNDGFKFFDTGKSLFKIKPREIVARFIFNKNHITKKGVIKFGAFIPNKMGDTSVNRICDLDEELIWEIGRFVESKRKQNLYGRADINVGRIFHNLLKIKPWPFPLLSHANITDYPAFDPQLRNAKQKEIAADLAKDSSSKVYSA